MPHSYIIMINFILHVCVNFHMVNNNVPASVGAPPLSTQLFLLLNALESSPYSRRICYICSRNVCFVVRIFTMNIEWLRYVVSFPDCVEIVLMTECYVPFHSLHSNGIRQEGCSALTAALQQCKQLQVLR